MRHEILQLMLQDPTLRIVFRAVALSPMSMKSFILGDGVLLAIHRVLRLVHGLVLLLHCLLQQMHGFVKIFVKTMMKNANLPKY